MHAEVIKKILGAVVKVQILFPRGTVNTVHPCLCIFASLSLSLSLSRVCVCMYVRVCVCVCVCVFNVQYLNDRTGKKITIDK